MPAGVKMDRGRTPRIQALSPSGGRYATRMAVGLRTPATSLSPSALKYFLTTEKGTVAAISPHAPTSVTPAAIPPRTRAKSRKLWGVEAYMDGYPRGHGFRRRTTARQAAPNARRPTLPLNNCVIPTREHVAASTVIPSHEFVMSF